MDDPSATVASSRSRETGDSRSSGGYRYSRALLIIFLATALDIFNVLDRASKGGPLRYFILVIPILALVGIRADGSTLIRRPRPHEVVLLALFVFGLIGTMYGIVFLGVTSTGRSLFLPMSVAVLSILVVEPVTEPEAAKLLRALAWIASVYIALGAIVYSGVWHRLLEYRQFKNATFPYVAIGIAAVYILGRPWWTAALVAGALVIFAGYSSATSALILVTMVLVFWATGTHASRYRPYMIGLAIAVAATLAIVNFGTSKEVAQSYFNAVDKRNTSYGRLEFWATGIAKFEESPIIGTAFASNTVADTNTTRFAIAPYHNDFILFLAEGGLVGAGLLAAWILLLLTDLSRRYFGFVRSRAPNRANLARLLLVGLSGFVVSMAFNPVLEGLSRSATIFSLAAIASTLGTPEPAPGDEAPREPPSPAVTSGATRADLRTRVR